MSEVGFRRFVVGLGGLLAGAGVGVGVAACGHAIQLRGHNLAVSELEYRLRPSQITAPDGALTVTVHNYGRLTHDLVIATPQPTRTVLTTPTGRQTETTTVAARSPDLPPGSGTTMTLALPPGRYSIASTLGNDQGQGMQGTLTVVSK